MASLTEKERLALRALAECATRVAGGDYGLVSSVQLPDGITINALAGLIGSLESKGFLDTEDTVEGLDGKPTAMYTLTDSGWEANDD